MTGWPIKTDIDLIEKVTDAIYEACGYAIPPVMVDACSVAALEAIKAHLYECAGRPSARASDYYGGVKEIGDQLMARYTA